MSYFPDTIQCTLILIWGQRVHRVLCWYIIHLWF